MTENVDYTSRGWLEQKYVDEEMSVPQMADLAGVHPETIYYHMDKHGIERDATRYGYQSRVEYATYYLDDQGYPRWQAKGREDGERVTDNFHVHRLLAIAEYGVEAVAGNVVHHQNEIPFDNRPSNIEVLSRSDHRSQHMTPEVVEKMIRARGDTVLQPAETEGGGA